MYFPFSQLHGKDSLSPIDSEVPERPPGFSAPDSFIVPAVHPI